MRTSESAPQRSRLLFLLLVASVANAEPGAPETDQQVDARIPYGLVFDGQKSYVSLPHVPFDDLDAFTVEAWVQGGEGRIFNQGKRGDPENSIWMSLGETSTVVKSVHNTFTLRD